MSSATPDHKVHVPIAILDIIAIVLLLAVPVIIFLCILLRFEKTIVPGYFIDVEAIPKKPRRSRIRQPIYDTFQRDRSEKAYALNSCSSSDSEVSYLSDEIDATENSVCQKPSDGTLETGPSRTYLLIRMQQRVKMHLKANWNCPDLHGETDLFRLALHCNSGLATLDQLHNLERMIDYRESAMKSAVRALRAMLLRVCWTPEIFDCVSFLRLHIRDDYFWTLYNLVYRSQLVPRPGQGEGIFHPKPVVYIAATCLIERVTPQKMGLLIRESEAQLSDTGRT